MKVLDLFCGAGGSAMGYHRAGFEVTGVDIKPQPRFPFAFIQADALDVLDLDIIAGFDLVHASPPCQRFSVATRRWSEGEQHPDLITPVRAGLQRSGVPYVIENVPGSPLHSPIMLCGSMFVGLQVRRHRLFEFHGLDAPQLDCRHAEQGSVVGVYGRPGGTSTRDGAARRGGLATWCEAMGVDWMSSRELAQAMPPAYTEYIGLFARAAVGSQSLLRRGIAALDAL